MAYHEGIVYPTYQWVFIERTILDFVYTDFSYSGRRYTCSATEMMTFAVNGSISFIPEFITTKDSNTTVSGQSYEEFLGHYQKKAKIHDALTTIWANPYYDSIWALALALNASLQDLQKRNFNLTEYGIGRQKFVRDFIQQLTVKGLSASTAPVVDCLAACTSTSTAQL